MTKIKYPIFLSGKPSGKDKIAGGSHKKTATIITKTIKSEILEKRVIGLEGEWGSGKSNVIKIIQEQLGDEYYTFIFDSWGNQEDLTRKSFLEQLIGQLFKKEFLIDAKKWLKLENQLLSKTSKIHKERFPKTKSYWVLLTISVLLLAGLSSLYSNVLSLNNDLIPAINFGPFWKPVISIYLVPLALFIWAICLGLKDYLELRSENEKKDVQKRESKWDTLGKIFYWFSGQEIDTEEVENVLEEEPSVKKFREYFSKIEEDIKVNQKKLVIVFDNIDRLEKDKVKSLWSSIHTFFAEDTETVESWIIVPYDKTKLNEYFGSNGFIEKTFAINFRVTPPVVTQWEAFLNQSIKDAFGANIIAEKEKEYIVKLFDILSSVNTIKPRQIINYVNDLAAQYLQWEKEVVKGEIKLRYLALFILVKDEILKSPNEAILSREYLKGAINQFENIPELDECMSALTFGVEKALANEVLLFRELQTILREGDAEKIKKYSNHAAFDSYFHKAYFSLEIFDKIKGLTDILETVSEHLSDNRRKQYWNDFANKMSYVDIDGEFEKFTDNHKAILINSSLNVSKKVLQRLIEKLRLDINSKEQINQNTYYEELIEIEEFLKENKEIKIDLIKSLKPVKFNAVPFIDLVSQTQEEYSKYKVKCVNEELVEYYFEGEKKDTIDLDKILISLEELVILNKEYKFEKLTNDIVSKLEIAAISQTKEIKGYIKILKKLRKKPLKLKLSNTFYSQLTHAKTNEDEIYLDALGIGISNFKDAHQYPNFKNALSSLTPDNIEKVCKVIEWYFTYGDLLMLIVLNPQASTSSVLKAIAKKITYNSYGTSRLNINTVISNFSKILGKVFDNDIENEKKFLNRINSWSESFKDDYDISKADEKIFSKLDNQEYELIKKITQSSINHVEGLSKEQILEAFEKKDKNFVIIKSLTENHLIEKYSDSFYSALDDYLKDVAKEKKSLPDVSFWDTLLSELDARTLKSTFTGIREILINERGELSEDEINFFEKGLIAHGNLHKKPEGIMLKFVIPMIKSESTFDVFLSKMDKLVPIINSSLDHKDMAISELNIKYNSEEYKDNSQMKELSKLLNLRKVKQKE